MDAVNLAQFKIADIIANTFYQERTGLLMPEEYDLDVEYKKIMEMPQEKVAKRINLKNIYFKHLKRERIWYIKQWD